MFNAAGGSILISARFHYQMNFPAWPDGQPWENYIFAFVALIVVLLNRKDAEPRSSCERGTGARRRTASSGRPVELKRVEPDALEWLGLVGVTTDHKCMTPWGRRGRNPLHPEV